MSSKQKLEGKKSHGIYEKISFEIHAWPLSSLLSCHIDHSNGYASNKKKGIGKSEVCTVRPEIPSLISNRGEGLLPSLATLKEQGALPVPTHTDSQRYFVFFLPHESSATLPVASQRGVFACVLSWPSPTGSSHDSSASF